MGLYTELPDQIQEVDVIVAGGKSNIKARYRELRVCLSLQLGGTAGCIIASRIADADPNLSVLVVEKGRNNNNERLIRHPAYFFQNLAPDGGSVTYYVGNKSENLAGREVAIPTASILGGGSSVNMVIYSRAQRSDYDSWNMPGWSADDLLPYMRKVLSLPSWQ